MQANDLMSRTIMVVLFLALSADQSMAQGIGSSRDGPVLKPILWSALGSFVVTGTALAATGNDFEVGGWPAPLSGGTIPFVEAGAVAGTMGGSYLGARIHGYRSPGLASGVSSVVAVYGLSLLLHDAENTMGSAPAILLFSVSQGTASVLGPVAWRWVAARF